MPDKYEIPHPLPPEQTESRPHPVRERLDRTALAVSSAAALFALAAAFFAYQQWRAADRQAISAEGARLDAKQAISEQKADVERSRKAAEDSAKSAGLLAEGMNRSARAAEQSAMAGRAAFALNRRALILSNAPSLQLLNIRLANALTVGTIPIATSRIFNGGKGNAYQAQLQQWMALSPQRKFEYPRILTPQSITDIAPGGTAMHEMSNELSRPLTADELQQIDKQQAFLYIYGRGIYYDNILENRRKYTWYWCGFYNPTVPGDKLLLGLCPEHNYTEVE